MHVEVLWPQQSKPSSASFHNEALPPSKTATGRHTTCLNKFHGPAGRSSGQVGALLSPPKCPIIPMRLCVDMYQFFL